MGMNELNETLPIIGISSCLLGEKVRYDGAHKYDDWINTNLKKFCSFHSVCPEMLMGLGAPRPTMRIVRDHSTKNLSLLSHDQNKDLTELALKTNAEIMSKLPKLSGYIFMKKSPSCGVERVKIYRSNNDMLDDTTTKGFFAKDFTEKFPLMPVIDSGRLFDDNERDHFLRSVFAFKRFHELNGSIASLQDFHARYKFVLMEYNQDAMRRLGKIAANSQNHDPLDAYSQYQTLFFSTLKKLPTIKNRVNSFSHLLGFFKDELDPVEKKMFLDLVHDYASGILPYAVPFKMIGFFIQKYKHYYLLNHYYLDPYPKALMPTSLK